MTNIQAAVVDFGTSKVVTIIAKGKAKKSERLEIIGSGCVMYDGFRDGDWNAPEKLVESVRNSISAAELQAHEKIHEVYIGVPSEYIRVYTGTAEVPITGPDGLVTVEDIDAVQDAVADKLKLLDEDGIVLHRSHAWFSIDDGPRVMTPMQAGAAGQKLQAQISFILAERQFMNDVAELMGILNITIAGYFSSSLGTALLMVPPEDRDNTSVLIDVGYLNTEINVVCGEAIVRNEVIDIGGSELIVALVDKLRIDMKEAERVKRTFSFKPDELEEQEDFEVRDPYSGRKRFIPHYDVADVMRDSMDGILDEIFDRMNNAGMFQMLSQNSKVYLTGGGIAMMRGARERLADALDIDVYNVTNKTAKLNYPMFSSALGLTNLVFDALIADNQEEETNVFGKLAGFFKR